MARSLAMVDPAFKNRFHLLYAQQSERIVNLIATWETDVGIVYRVDAINNGLLRIIDETPAGTNTTLVRASGGGDL